MQKRCVWSNPAENPFEVIIRQLVALAPAATPPDFSRILVVVPGRLWGRNLKEALVQRFPQGVCPPEILTPGGVLHYGMERLRPASAGEQLVIWEYVLKRLKDKPAFKSVFPQRSGGICSDLDCRNLAKVFLALRQELVQGGKTMEDAAKILEKDRRWTTLAALEICFTAALKDFDLLDPAELNKRCVSPQSNAALSEKFSHVLVAFLPDVPKLLEEKLQGANTGITLLIHGDAGDADKFDAWGRPAAIWRETKLPIDAAHLHAIATPEQAALLTLAIGTQNGKQPFDPAHSAIVLGKPGFFPAFESAFQKIHYENETRPVALFSPDGVPGNRLRIAVFLQKLSSVLHDEEEFAAFHALLRDDAFSGYLRSGSSMNANQFLSALDRFTLQALPDRTTPAIAFLKGQDPVLASVLQKALDVVRTLQTAADFCAELKKLLKAVFDRPGYPPTLGISFDDEVEYWQKAIAELQRSPIQTHLLPDAERKLRYLLQDCESVPFYPGRDNDAILVYNFLEYPALTQPELFIVGMNWGITPAVRGITPYLTDSIRKQLGLEHWESLAALEAYKMIMLLQGKPGTHLLTLKLDETNTPLRPAGMLFAGCGDAELLERARCCREAEPLKACTGVTQADRHFGINLKSMFQQPFFQKNPLEFSVTDFKKYLNSPRLFLLQKVFHVDCPDYAEGELDDSRFGSACHEGFRNLLDFGCTTEAEYGRVLKAGADAYLYRQCGKSLPLLVELQREQIHLRLQAAAKYLAQEHGNYRLLEAEYAIAGGKSMDFGGARIKGQIDRIELSADGKTLRLIDIKTYNSAEDRTPEKDHLKGRTEKTFINLQLPLYHQLLMLDAEFWARHNLNPYVMTMEAGYLLLTADSDAAELKLWKKDFTVWSKKAQETVERIVRELETFRLTGELPPEPKSANYYNLASLFVPTGKAAFMMGKR